MLSLYLQSIDTLASVVNVNITSIHRLICEEKNDDWTRICRRRASPAHSKLIFQAHGLGNRWKYDRAQPRQIQNGTRKRENYTVFQKRWQMVQLDIQTNRRVQREKFYRKNNDQYSYEKPRHLHTRHNPHRSRDAWSHTSTTRRCRQKSNENYEHRLGHAIISGNGQSSHKDNRRTKKHCLEIDIDEHLEREHKKLAKFGDRDIRDRIADLKEERASRLEITTQNSKELPSQFSRIRQTIEKIVDGDLTLREKVKLAFREQGITITAVLTAFGLIISTIITSLTGGAGTAGGSPNPPKRVAQKLAQSSR